MENVKNGQTYFKNIAIFTRLPGHFSTVCMKGLNLFNQFLGEEVFPMFGTVINTSQQLTFICIQSLSYCVKYAIMHFYSLNRIFGVRIEYTILSLYVKKRHNENPYFFTFNAVFLKHIEQIELQIFSIVL